METREDPAVDFDWGVYQYNAPHPAEARTFAQSRDCAGPGGSRRHAVDYWSARWSGYLMAPARGRK